MVFGVAQLAGVALATVAATSFAIYYICVRLGTERGNVSDVMLISLLTNVIITVPLVAIIHGIPEITLRSLLAFVAAGISGSLLARITLIKSVQAIGASRTSPVAASNVFFASILAIILFDEQLTGMHFLGIVFIVVGVALITWETASEADPDASLREIGPSLALPVIGAVLLGFEPIFITIGLADGSGVLPGVAIKAIAATAGYVLYLRFRNAIRRDIFSWNPHMKWYLGAGVTSTVGIISLFAALAVAPVVLVIPLLQTSPLIVVVISAIMLPKHLERVTLPLVAGALVVVIGATLVSIYA